MGSIVNIFCLGLWVHFFLHPPLKKSDYQHVIKLEKLSSPVLNFNSGNTKQSEGNQFWLR